MNTLCIALLLALLAFAGCEQNVENPDDTIYTERFVTFGILRDGQLVDSIQFTRTLPLTSPYTADAAALTDVNATITAGSGSAATVYPLQHIGGGYYRAAGLTAHAGETYVLNANWHGHVVTAQTMVPQPAVVERVTPSVEWTYYPYSSNTVYSLDFDVAVRAVATQSYAITRDSVSIPGDLLYTTQRGFYHVLPGTDTLSDGRVHLTFNDGYSVDSAAVFSRVYGSVTIVSYDAPYYEYYTTEPSGRNNSNPFDIGGSPQTVRWNVHGDGFGMFVGQAVVVSNF